jgi:hypothetical protein
MEEGCGDIPIFEKQKREFLFFLKKKMKEKESMGYYRERKRKNN